MSKKGSRKAATGPSKEVVSPNRWLMLVGLASALGLLLGAGMIALSLISVSSAQPTVAPPAIKGQDPPGLERRTKGSPDAPVVLTEWSDYQCPACARVALTRDPVLEQMYADTGKVRFVYRNLPFLGPESFLAAEAAECAADQGRYWDYRNLLFQRQQGENRGAFSAEKLKGFAAELGLDVALFSASLDQGKHRAAIQAEAREGDLLNIDATPTYFINGRMIDGLPTLEGMQKLIEEELAR